jgi:hypothetical protein
METFREEGLYFGKGEIILYFVTISFISQDEKESYKV